jgi:[acyl-carrier-protein] S-malonyltransferase
MPTAFLFPGQGAQVVGMARDLYEEFTVARDVVDRANEVLDYNLADIMFGVGMDPADAAERLRQTNYTQPALYVHSFAAWAVLRDAGAMPACTAGHSLGEYSALAAAGALSFEDGLNAVRRRGEFMADANRARSGGMMAILGLDDDAATAVCDRVERQTGGTVRPANYNAPGQVVISGDVDAVAAAGRLATEAGAQKVIPLVVGGAFHSPLMTDAAEGLSEVLNEIEVRTPVCPVFLNVTAEAVTEPEVIRALLLEQLVSPVRWSQSVEAMHQFGVDQYVEVGTGKVLSGLAKRILDRSTVTHQAGTAKEIRSFIATLKAAQDG